MDLFAQMTTFVRVVESGSLSSAARQVGLSPAAVSRQLDDLERQLETRLLTRTTRKVVVTEVGLRYYEDALRILRDLEGTHAALRGGGRLRGKLVVSVPVTFGLTRVSPLIPPFLRKHPGLELDIRYEDRRVDLVGEGVDVAIRIGGRPANSTSIVARALGRYLRLAVASPAFLRARSIPDDPAALDPRDALVHAPEDKASAWVLDRDGRRVRLTPAGGLRTNVVFALREAALAGLGVALLPEWLVAEDVVAGRLHVVWPEFRGESIEVVALHRVEAKSTPRVRAFIDYLSNALKPSPLRG